MNNRLRFVLIALSILIAFGLGWLSHRPTSRPEASHAHADAASEYTCSMHPSVRLADPDAPCPLCGMDLIPVAADSGEDTAAPVLTLTPQARALAQVATAPVERRFVESGLQLLGKVTADETRVRRISAWAAGRLDRLFVDYTGIRVAAGDHLAELYSPELIAAQEEFLQAKRATGSFAESTRRASEEKLRLLGFSDAQIDALSSGGEAADHVTVTAPMGGIVLERHAVEGAYVKVGAPLVSIADLSGVWVKLDAYESDLPLLHYGQNVEFESIAHPGDRFAGRVAYIDPVVDETTRTVKVRVNVDNADGRLKPGMFVRASVTARLGEGGRVADADLAGKWISPMHPEVVKDGPGSCDVCGMDLVPAEDLGFVGGMEGAPLVIPATAPLITGKRAVVYVEDPGEPGRYEGREVELGPRAGEHYLVAEGLAEGERVVTRGNFKIDSALQILAKPSMMNPVAVASAEPVAHEGHGHADATPAADPVAALKTLAEGDRLAAPASFLKQIEKVYDAYFDMKDALAHDKHGKASKRAKALGKALGKIEMADLDEPAHMLWMELQPALKDASASIGNSAGIESARRDFEPLSAAVAALGARFGREKGKPLFVYYCSMAFDFEGADWLQEKEGTENPYFGSAMFKCGTLQRNLSEEK